jgi:hypothetical protein
VGTSRERAVAFLWDLENLPKFEPKVAQVRQLGGGTGYAAVGTFAGLEWRGTFDCVRSAAGFRTRAQQLPWGLQVDGAYVVRTDTDASCWVTHHEIYTFPIGLRPLAPLLVSYLSGSMREALEDLRYALHLADGAVPALARPSLWE